MRQIIHPGPVADQRTTAVCDRPVELRFSLDPGLTVDQAIAEGFAAAGCLGGFVSFDHGVFEPFRYVMPALSRNSSHAAWYSETFAPDGPVSITSGCAIVGLRDGRTFIHCHGIWETAEGRKMGHMLAPETIVSEPTEVRGLGFGGATFESLEDAETNFRLFEPVHVGQDREERLDGMALLAKVRPNEDICLAIEDICRRRGITSAEIFGIGSLNEVRFAGGGSVDSLAAEVMIKKGRVETVNGQAVARLEIAVVDVEGGIFEGELIRGDNPVCVTFELVIRT